MSKPSARRQFLLLCWVCVAAYAAMFFAFVSRALPHAALNVIGLGVLVIGPPLFYGTSYFLYHNREMRAFVKELSTMWAPLWVAAAAFALVLYAKVG